MPAIDRPGPLRVADVGTGSGAVAVALAVALRARRVPPDDLDIVALDVSEDALDLARENAVAHGVGDRLRFVASDLLPPDARPRRSTSCWRTSHTSGLGSWTRRLEKPSAPRSSRDSRSTEGPMG